MQVCWECKGNGFLQHGQRMVNPGGTSFTFFGDNKQWPETTCPSCLGTGQQINTGGA